MPSISIPSGSITMFQNSEAPVGWTRLTSNHDCMVNIRSGSVSTGGTRAFSTVFNTVPISGALSVTSMSSNPTVASSPTHFHKGGQNWGSTSPAGPVPTSFSGTTITQWYPGSTTYSNYVGSSAAHNHAVPTPASMGNMPFSNTLDFRLKYVDVIVAQRN